MPGSRHYLEPPPESHRSDTRQQEAEVGSPYDPNGDRLPERAYDRRDRYRDENDPEESRRRRGRSASVPLAFRSDRGRDYRSRDYSPRRERTDRSRSRRRGSSDRTSYRAPSVGNDRDRNAIQWQDRTPRDEHRQRTPPQLRPQSPSRSLSTGYTIIDHRTNKRVFYGVEYGLFSESPYNRDLTKALFTADVISVRFCDFSSDTQANIGETFTPSSQGLPYVKIDVPLIVVRVEQDYVLGCFGRSSGDRGLRGSRWISKSEHPKYLGIATEDDPEGSQGNDSPHDQLKVVRRNESRTLLSTTHVYAGELVKVTMQRKPKYGGHLSPKEYYRFQCLSKFLTASPGSPDPSIDSVPTDIGLGIGSLRTLRTPEDSMRKGWLEELAALEARHERRPATADTMVGTRKRQAQAQAQAKPMGPGPLARVRPVANASARPASSAGAQQGTRKATSSPTQRLTIAENGTRNRGRQPPNAPTAPRVLRSGNIRQAQNP